MGTHGESLIDPPFNPYAASLVDIENWIAELESREQSDSVDMALREARSWLRFHPDYVRGEDE